MNSLGTAPAPASTQATTGLGQEDLSLLDELMKSTIGSDDTLTAGVTQGLYFGSQINLKQTRFFFFLILTSFLKTLDELNELNDLMSPSGGGDGLDDLDDLMKVITSNCSMLLSSICLVSVSSSLEELIRN